MIFRSPPIYLICFSLLSSIIFADDTTLLYSHNSLQTLEKIVNFQLKKYANGWLSIDWALILKHQIM